MNNNEPIPAWKEAQDFVTWLQNEKMITWNINTEDKAVVAWSFNVYKQEQFSKQNENY